MERWLTQFCVNGINATPTTSYENAISPKERLTGRKIDEIKDLKHEFGEYVQIHAGIALLLTGNADGTWWYLMLLEAKPS